MARSMIRARPSTRVAWLAIAICAGVRALAQAPQQKNVEVIFDASGSMMTPTSRFTAFQDKVEIAKSELQRYVENLPEANIRLAIRVFGTDRSQSCADSILLQPLVLFRKADVAPKIAPIHPAPKGRTPIARNLELALQDFQAVDTKGAENCIILLTDGVESCGGDVDKAIDKITKAGIDLKVNIVGFDVLDADNTKVATQLTTLAEKTGGKADFPKTQAELEQSLRALSPPTAPPPKVEQEQTASQMAFAWIQKNALIVMVAGAVLLAVVAALTLRSRG
ncbi:MAG: VWA domain-containing protein [Acidobacteriota bacterium]